MAKAKGKLSSQELLDNQTHVWNHVYGFVNAMALKCAIQLGIPDAIHQRGRPTSISELTHDLALNEAKSGALRRLMRLLVHSKFFELINNNNNNEEEAYCLTGASRLLLRGEATSMAPYDLLALTPFSVDPWFSMSDWFRDERSSPFETKHGMTLWEFAAEGRDGGLFNEGMACDTGLVARVLGRECRNVFEGLKTMVDVAGGVGAMARGVAAEFPELECVVLDLPHVVEGLEGGENLRFVGGDMFEFVPPANAVFLKWILHDWSDEDCVKILEKCKEAITRSTTKVGKVIIVEVMVEDRKEDHKATETQLFFDLQMMTVLNGKERTEKEWATLFHAAGFDNYKITPVLGLRSVIEVFP